MEYVNGGPSDGQKELFPEKNVEGDHSYDEEEIFNRKDIVSIFNVNQNNTNELFNAIDEESYFNNVDENCIVEEIANDMQKCLDKEITEKLNKAFEDTADTLLTSNLMLM